MAQICHPNLVRLIMIFLFVAAALNEQKGSMIVTELLDTSLRSVYQDNCVGPNKRRIFGDLLSSGLSPLTEGTCHLQKCPPSLSIQQQIVCQTNL